jgi:hypothetical protein
MVLFDQGSYLLQSLKATELRGKLALTLPGMTFAFIDLFYVFFCIYPHQLRGKLFSVLCM